MPCFAVGIQVDGRLGLRSGTALQMSYVLRFAKVPYGMPVTLDEAASSITLMRSALLVKSQPVAVPAHPICSCVQLAPHPLQVWCAIIGRCLLHLVFEFQAFLNLYVQQVLSISAGAAAQVSTTPNCSSFQILYRPTQCQPRLLNLPAAC